MSGNQRYFKSRNFICMLTSFKKILTFANYIIISIDNVGRGPQDILTPCPGKKKYWIKLEL